MGGPVNTQPERGDLPATTEEAPEAPQDQPTLSAEELEAIRAHNDLVRAVDNALSDIRQRSYEGKLTTPARWKRLAVAPENMDTAAFETYLLDYIEDHDHADDSPAMGDMDAPAPLEVELAGREVSPDERLEERSVEDIVILYGKKATYFYSKPLMSHSFARALYLTAEDDDLSTFVEVVRDESRTYPRPVSIFTFMNPPYLWPCAKTREIFEEARGEDVFGDIEVCEDSEGEEFYYSTRYLSAAQGKALAEWYGVEKGRNP